MLKDLSGVNARIEGWRHLCCEMDDLSVLEDMLRDAEDAELQGEFERRAAEVRRTMEHSSLILLLNEEYDSSNAILTVHAGISPNLDSEKTTFIGKGSAYSR